jgi:hypothetical protein
VTTIDPMSLAFDQHQRYRVVSEIAELVRAGRARYPLRVLDVGGFFRTRRGEPILPLAHYLPGDQVFAVDLVAEALPGYALSSGLALPFRERAFDLVASCDTLEHVSPGERPAFLDELLRVAEHCLVLVAPFDGPARQAERMVYEYLTSHGFQHAAFREHLALGLPDPSTLRASLAERGLAFAEFPDGYLHHWLLMMLIKHTPGLSLDLDLDLDRYYNQHLSSTDRREPAYRRAFVVAQPGNEDLIPIIAERFRPMDAPSSKPLFDVAAELIEVLKRGQDTALAQALRVAEDRLDVAYSRLRDVQTENERLHQTVQAYRQGRFMRFMRWLYLMRRRFGI